MTPKEDDPFQNEFVFRDRAATNANLIGHPGLNSSGEFGDIHGYGNTDSTLEGYANAWYRTIVILSVN